MDRSVFTARDFDVKRWVNRACEQCPEGERPERCALAQVRTVCMVTKYEQAPAQHGT